MKDLTGQRFGWLTAVRPTEERRNGSVVWECKCDCGNTVFTSSDCLRFGKTKSCGCLRKDTIANTTTNTGVYTNKLTGQRFGRLIAVRPTEERRNGSIVWECKCDCGNTVYPTSASLSSGRTRSCGCLKKEIAAENGRKSGRARAKDLTGQRFGRLTVIARNEQSNNPAKAWECKCDCGNTTFVNAYKLESGMTKSCGCLHREYLSNHGKRRSIDLFGKRFGRLIALRPTEERKRGNVVWECKCDCGNTAFISSVALNGGDTQSCGCLRRENALKMGRSTSERKAVD